MCTAITLTGKDLYFGRNLDLERNYNEMVVITPRKYQFKFRNNKVISSNLAMIGMAAVVDNYPLYFDAINESGLCIAGLNFPENANYFGFNDNMNNIAPFEFIPWILSQCKTTNEAVALMKNINLWDESFSKELQNTPLHWIISDKEKCITVEPMHDGLKIYDNEIGILTNNPPFPYHVENLNNYINITAQYPTNRFSTDYKLQPYSLGMGALGLPGDPSSTSRFVRAAFTKLNSSLNQCEKENVSQFFHILRSVEQQKGITTLPNGDLEFTTYSCCGNASRGIYYYTTYHNHRINAVSINNENLESETLITFPLNNSQDICFVN